MPTFIDSTADAAEASEVLRGLAASPSWPTSTLGALHTCGGGTPSPPPMRSMRSRVVPPVAEPAGDTPVELDQPVDGLAIAGAAGVEVGQERVLPLFRVRPRRATSGPARAGH